MVWTLILRLRGFAPRTLSPTPGPNPLRPPPPAHGSSKQTSDPPSQVSGRASNTLVAFAADNGPEDPAMYLHSVGNPGPFRGRKRSLYEGGIRVPFVVRWPGVIPANRRSTAPLSPVDWMPTVARLVGLRLAPAAKSLMSGEDNAALLQGHVHAAAPRRMPLMWDYRFGQIGSCVNESPRVAILGIAPPPAVTSRGARQPKGWGWL